jgi:hypothetical protein
MARRVLRRPASTTLATALAVVALTLAAITSAPLTSVAWAGEYHVYSCRTPAGQVAPTDGWSHLEHPLYDQTLNTCESGGGLVAALGAGYPHLADSEFDKATWQFNAPEGEAIVGATLWRAGGTLGGSNTNASYLFWLSGFADLGTSARIFDECRAGLGCAGRGNPVEPFAAENRVVAPDSALNSPYLSLSAYCGAFVDEAPCPANEGGKITYDALVELFAADLVLSQPQGPTVSAVGGGLAEDPTLQGTADVAFHAADPGSGVYEAHIEVDGQLVGHAVLDEDGGRCRDVGGTSDGLPAFLYTQPCPAAVSADVPLDTVALTDGVHHLVVSVTDAAGNVATVLDREITVANPSPAVGSPTPGSVAACAADAAGAGAVGTGTVGTGAVGVGARAPGSGAGVTLVAGWRPHARARVRARYGAAHTIEGRLAGPGGAPLAGAQLEVCERPAYAGAPPIPLAAPRTDAAGRFALALPRDLPSCALRVAYRPDLAGPPTAGRTLTLTVPAPLELRIAPRLARSQGAIRFAGRLLGGPIPAGGKQLVLEARAPGGRWIEFHVIRTGALGHMRYLYRFRLPGPAAYQFRVLSEPEADFPFAAGVSNVVDVLER